MLVIDNHKISIYELQFEYESNYYYMCSYYYSDMYEVVYIDKKLKIINFKKYVSKFDCKFNGFSVIFGSKENLEKMCNDLNELQNDYEGMF